MLRALGAGRLACVPDIPLLFRESGQELVGGDLAGDGAQVPRVDAVRAAGCKGRNNGRRSFQLFVVVFDTCLVWEVLVLPSNTPCYSFPNVFVFVHVARWRGVTDIIIIIIGCQLHERNRQSVRCF